MLTIKFNQSLEYTVVSLHDDRDGDITWPEQKELNRILHFKFLAQHQQHESTTVRSYVSSYIRKCTVSNTARSNLIL